MTATPAHWQCSSMLGDVNRIGARIAGADAGVSLLAQGRLLHSQHTWVGSSAVRHCPDGDTGDLHGPTAS